ncbi:MAG: sigma factor [Clostridium sp.]|nr:sigma factor [Clostridium sp.]
MEEQLILKGIKKSNIQSYEWLIDQYASYVSKVIMKVANRQLTIEEVEELSADVFIGIWEKREQLQIESGKLKPYLAAMARNKTINRLKAKGRVELIPLEEDSIDYETPESELVKQEDEVLTYITFPNIEALQFIKIDEVESIVLEGITIPMT